MPCHHNIEESIHQDTSNQPIHSEPAKGISYFTPAQVVPSGKALDPDPPKLFQPLKLRGVTLQNRIMVFTLYARRRKTLTLLALTALSILSG